MRSQHVDAADGAGAGGCAIVVNVLELRDRDTRHKIKMKEDIGKDERTQSIGEGRILLLLTAISACSGTGGADKGATESFDTPAGDTIPDDTSSPDSSAESGEAEDTHTDTSDSDTDSSLGEPPCADGWGYISDPENAVHVRADGIDESATGRADAPYGTLDAAIGAWRSTGASEVAIGPGEFYASLLLAGDRGDGTSDSGLVIEGCSPDEVTLKPPVDSEGQPILQYTDVESAVLRGVTLQGGYRPLWLWAGTTASIESVSVVEGERAGIVVVGSDTDVSLVDVNVLNPISTPDYAGDEAAYGISVDGASISMEGGGIWGATEVGFLAAGADVNLDDVSISDTIPGSAGEFGRGIHLQSYSIANLENVILDSNTDAGIFSSQSLYLSLKGVEISNTSAGILDGLDDTTGDGIVISQGDEDAGLSDPSLFETLIQDCVVSSSARAGIVVQDVLISSMTGNISGSDNGLAPDGISVLTQGDTLFGSDVTDSYVDLEAEGIDSLNFNWSPLVVERGD